MLYKADVWQKANGRTAVSVALEHPDGLQLLIDAHKDDEARAVESPCTNCFAFASGHLASCHRRTLPT